jgi:hypothetical protein
MLKKFEEPSKIFFSRTFQYWGELIKRKKIFGLDSKTSCKILLVLAICVFMYAGNQ